MKDKIKTRKQLINEPAGLRERSAELGNPAKQSRQTGIDLLKTKEHLDNIIESSLDGIVVGDSTGKITRVNKSFLKLVGFKEEEILGKHTYNFTPTEEGTYESTTGEIVEIKQKYFNDTNTMLEKLLEEGKIENRESYFVREDKKVVPVEENIVLLHNEEGEVTGSVGTIRDITERKKTEEALKKSEEKYHSLIDNANDSIISTNGDGIIISFNKTAEKMFGYGCEEIMGESITLLSPPENREQQRKLFEKFKSTNNLYIIGRTMEGKGLKKDGQEFPFEGSVCVLELDEERIITVILRDITERKKGEEERKRLLDELKDKNMELAQIFYIASHDLRSPLVNIQGFSRELEQAFKDVQSILSNSEGISSQTKEKLAPALEEDIPEALQFILTSISKMDSLLSGLLRLSRLGRAALNMKKLDMNKLVLDITKSFEYQVKETGITLKIDELPSCLGDETQINQVFSNLVDNALKYLNPGQTGAITISGRRDNGHAVYYVEDNGIGIAPEHQDKVYEIFHRLNPTATQGEGLGLTIVRRILDRHTGKIWVESEPGKGSKFIVSLPTN